MMVGIFVGGAWVLCRWCTGSFSVMAGYIVGFLVEVWWPSSLLVVVGFLAVGGRVSCR